MRTLVQACRKHSMSNEIVGGLKTDQAVNAIWAVMVYHTPALNQALNAYGNAASWLAVRFQSNNWVLLFHLADLSLFIIFMWIVNQDCKSFLSEDFVQVYLLADSIRTWMVSITPMIYVWIESLYLISFFFFFSLLSWRWSRDTLLAKWTYMIKKGIKKKSPWTHWVRIPENKTQKHQSLEECLLIIASFLSSAETCIEKSLLLFRFAPCGKSCQGSSNTKATEDSSTPLIRTSSISEGDFQPSSSQGPQSGSSDEASDARPGESQVSSSKPPNSSSSEHTRRGHRDSAEILPSQPGEPASPSTFPRKAPFSRSRLRLLSYRSVEDSHMTPSVKERYPILKHILNFMKDQALTTTR